MGQDVPWGGRLRNGTHHGSGGCRGMGTPAPSVRRNISCEARRAVRWAAPGHAAAVGARLPKRGGGEGCCGRTQLGRCSGKHTRRRTVRSPNDVAATGVREHGGPSASMQSALATTHLLQPSARKTLRALNCGKIFAPCVIREVSAAKRAPPWQDLRAVHSRKAICRAFRTHGAHILPTSARFGCMAAICCQEGALFPARGHFWDA